ncbi:MAG: acyltransferase family protein [Oscillospiraceae bacterium]|nr:acyltransferase family protein [Oscillospiraceae bacterium]
MAQTMQNGRLAWPDVLRALAVYSVLLAHLGVYSAYVSMFCFGYVIQLFFFVSGLFACVHDGQSLPTLAKWLIRRLLIPYIFLCAVNMLFYGLRSGLSLQKMLLECVLAIRNRLFAPTLWFVPCLIVMTCVYYGLKRLLKNRRLLLAVCCAISLAFLLFKETSQWFWSADSALMFLFYYALGDCAMPFLRRVDASYVRSLTPGKKLAGSFYLVLCAALSVLLYLFVSPTPQLDITLSDTTLKLFIFFACLGVISLLIVLSMLLQRSELLRAIGRATLPISLAQSLCSWLFFNVCWLLGITWQIWKDYQVLFYGAALLLFSYYSFALPLRSARKAVLSNLELKRARRTGEALQDQ